ncbi:MAG: hypothetical protein M1118_09585 [Chloroflexi bacterium]|nr:hypothetical protein [Chloroflexota bacterium]
MSWNVVRLLRMGESDRSIAGCLGHTRRSIARYRAWAQGQGLLKKKQATMAAAALRAMGIAVKRLPTAALGGADDVNAAHMAGGVAAAAGADTIGYTPTARSVGHCSLGRERHTPNYAQTPVPHFPCCSDGSRYADSGRGSACSGFACSCPSAAVGSDEFIESSPSLLCGGSPVDYR